MPSAAVFNKRPEQMALGADNVLSLIESLVGPVSLISCLLALAWYFDGEIDPSYLVMSVVVFALTYPGNSRLQRPLFGSLVDIAVNWVLIAGLLLLTGWAMHYLDIFPRDVLLTWLWAAPLTELTVHLALRAAAPTLLRLSGPPRHAIIVGMNEQGLALAERITNSRYTRIQLQGFVDGRDVSRLPADTPYRLLGKMDHLATLARSHHAELIYLSLPMASQPRILQVLDDLKDTTASIYFAPDMFVTDLIQGRTSAVCGLPVISVCETPFRGSNGVVKRLSDIILSLVILTMIAPLLALIALAVKLSSPGPVIFKQRRYGLGGEEIRVYKFRSMTCTEDCGKILQAKQHDKRVTKLGAFLRRTSLDELPQFVNVLQGRMSIVGPRPHAVAHNELYRTLIKGYMVRHKVKPGITGWAQINGFRGETDTLDKMQGRIALDLDYLRNWSLRLDIHIIMKTVRVILKDQKAY